MASELRIAAAALVLVVAAGCARRPSAPTGILFSYSTRPLTTNFHQTPVVDGSSNAGSIFQVQYYVRFDWGDNSIGRLAEEAGFDEVYYADITTLRVYSYFKMERVRVYGHRRNSTVPPPPPLASNGPGLTGQGAVGSLGIGTPELDAVERSPRH